jgi:hypothetical protein
MPNPTLGDVHVNRPLTNILVGFLQKADNFIWNRLFPLVPVDHMSDSYYIWDQADFYRDEARLRAAGTETAGVGMRLSTASYAAQVWGIHHDIPDMIRSNADQPLDQDEAATRLVGQKLMIRNERIFGANFFATSVWGRDVTGVAAAPGANQFLQWNDGASNPIQDVRAEIITQAEKTGYRPNKFAMGSRVWIQLEDHADILDRIKYTEKGVVTKDLVASLFELDEVLASAGVYNTAAEGQTGSYSLIVGKSALLAYAAPSPSIFEPSAGYAFSWNGYLGATNEFGARVKSFYLPQIAAERVEGEMAIDQKVVSTVCGTYFASAVA